MEILCHTDCVKPKRHAFERAWVCNKCDKETPAL